MSNQIRQGLRGDDFRTIRKEMSRTRRAMWAETLVRAMWPVFVVVCLILSAGLLGIYEVFGPIVHWILLCLSGLAVAGGLVMGGMALRGPTVDDATERLDESDPRRPLRTLADKLAVGRGTDDAELVWQAHRERARKLLPTLKAAAPDLRLASRDTWALRFTAPVILVGALIATRDDISGRLAAVVDPADVVASAEAQSFARNPAAEAWAMPPAYTGLDTIYLTELAADEASIEVPQGSEITIRVTDALQNPELSGSALAGFEGFSTLGGGLAEARGVLSSSGDIRVELDGDTLARFKILMTPDSPPAIEFDGYPIVTATRALELAFTAQDDYGVAAAWAEIAPDGHDPENSRGLPLPVITLGLPLPLSGDTRSITDATIRDFTSHPWAGAEVVARLYAEDGAAQIGEAAPLKIRLPERYFSHPVARALVEQRRELALDYDQAARVLDVLQAVMRRPYELFEEPQPGPYLTIRTAIRRLAGGLGDDAIPEVAPEIVELLWLAALGLEDGDLSSALERLRQAQERLRQALESGTEEDIREAMEELRAALNEYLQQLAQQAPQGQQQQQGQMDPNQMLSQQDLQEMLDQMQRQAESGARDEARQMLSELNRMLENLQSAQRQQGQQSPGQQALQDLQEMIQRQRDLSDRTFDELREGERERQQQGQQGRQQPGQEGEQNPGWGDGQGQGNQHGQQGQEPGEGMGDREMEGSASGPGGLAQQQEALRQELEELSRSLGSDQAARALEEAVQSMGDARDNLQDGQNGNAVRDQMDALDRLNEGAQALAEEVQQGQGETQAEGEQRGEGEGRDASRNDPFDRPAASYGALEGRSTRVPDQELIDRARELMEELRRRAAEPSRPQLELEYLDRLMERF
ncbi:MAG: TIGR02302 family protein [Pseudomonadota bacterium]